MISVSKKSVYLIVVLTMLALAGSIWLSQGITILEISNVTNHKSIYRHRFNPGESFAFKYIHSVQKTPVWEYYTLDRSGLVVLTATKVKSVGYGMPKPKQGDSYAFKDDFFMVDNLNQPIKELLIRNTFIRPMEIFCADKILKLRDFADRGDLIRISGQKKTRIRFFRDQLET